MPARPLQQHLPTSQRGAALLASLCFATVLAILRSGAMPVLADIRPDTALLDIEELSEDELDARKRLYACLAREALEDIRNGRSDLGTPELKRADSKEKG